MSNTIDGSLRMQKCLLQADFPCFPRRFPVSPLPYSSSSFQHFYINQIFVTSSWFPFESFLQLSLQTEQMTDFKFMSLIDDLRFWQCFTCSPTSNFLFSTMHPRNVKSDKLSWTGVVPQQGRHQFNFTEVSQRTRKVVLQILKHWSLRCSTRWHTLMHSSNVRKFKQFLNTKTPLHSCL